jgi:beta-mannosidase
LFDYYRRPYKVYESMRGVYSRVLISLERDAAPYVLGREKLYQRESSFAAKIWVNNDHTHSIDDARVEWNITCIDSGDVVVNEHLSTMLPADSVEEAGRISWSIPANASVGTYRVGMQVVSSDGLTLSTNHTDFTVS